MTELMIQGVIVGVFSTVELAKKFREERYPDAGAVAYLPLGTFLFTDKNIKG